MSEINAKAKQRVLAALSHKEPESTPFSWGFGPTPEMGGKLKTYFAGKGIDWNKLRNVSEDIVYAGPEFTGKMPPDGNTYTGIWGIKLKKMSYGEGEYQEFTDFPLAGLERPEQLDAYPWPDPLAYDYRNFRSKVLAEPAMKMKGVKIFSGNPFEIYSWMTGLEEALVNTIVNPDFVKHALSHITGFFMKRLELSMKEAGDMVDIVFVTDDLGSQNGLLISRESYREIIQPFHRMIMDCAKKFNPRVKIMFHSDGAVFDVIPDLIDAGVDILEAVQTDAAGMEPERLKSAYGDKISFHGAISVQSLLPYGDEKKVREECARIVKVLGKGGGYIPAPSHAIQIGTPPENVIAMMEGVLGKERLEEYISASKI